MNHISSTRSTRTIIISKILCLTDRHKAEGSVETNRAVSFVVTGTNGTESSSAIGRTRATTSSSMFRTAKRAEGTTST